jgi:hypothetical protein
MLNALTLHFWRKGSQTFRQVGTALWKGMTSYIRGQIFIFGLDDDVCNEGIIIIGPKVVCRWLSKF